MYALRPFAPSHFAVSPSEYTLAVLFIFLPVSLVSASIGVNINTRAVGFIVFKLAFVVIAADRDIASFD